MPDARSLETWRLSGEVPHEGRLGVIDIGSNSIRLVVYDAIKRAPLPLFNEKVFCGLGRGLATTGKLNPEGVKLAEACIARFLALVRIMDVVELQILAMVEISAVLCRIILIKPKAELDLSCNLHISITCLFGIV